MIITQNANESVTILRFDTDENITINKGDSIDLDIETAAYLLNMRTFTLAGVDAVDMSVVSLTAEEATAYEELTKAIESLEDVSASDFAAAMVADSAEDI